MKAKKKFNLRSFVTFSLVISTIIMSWSGFILYVAPPGRIANWGTWKLMFFTKMEWQALHTIFSYLFFILFAIHLFFVNWKTFITYFKSKIKAGLNRKWELGTAVVLSGIIFAGTLRSWTPFGPVMSFGEKAKASWDGKVEAPPVLHMETYTIEQLSTDFDSISPSELVRTLTDNNIMIDISDSTLRQVAERNHVTPASVYNILASKYQKSGVSEQGSLQQGGYGKYTLQMVSERSGKELNELISALRGNGVNADGRTTLRAIGEDLGMSPRDVYNLLVEGNK